MADDKESRSRRWAIDGPYWWVGMLATMALCTPMAWVAFDEAITLGRLYVPHPLMLIPPCAAVVIIGVETRLVARSRWGAALIALYLLGACYGVGLFLVLLTAGLAPHEEAWNLFVAGCWAAAMLTRLPKFYRLVFRRSKGAKQDTRS